jgi:hypothetical protein
MRHAALGVVLPQRTWSDDTQACQATPQASRGAPKPFPGLTRKPCCAACEQAAQEPAASPPPSPPPPIISNRGRPRQVDTSQQFCPHPDCAYRGWVGLGNITANGHPNGSPWRQLYCSQCEGYVLETYGTPLYGKRVSADLLVWAVGALAEGLGIRAVARVFEGDANTVLQWLVVVHQVVQVLAPDCVPLFLTDGYKDYITALLTHFGHWIQPERRQAKGPIPKPRWMPLPWLLYAQVIKVTRRRRLVEVKHRVVFGTKAAVEQVLAACGWQINTAFIERVNLSIRHHVAAGGAS